MKTRHRFMGIILFLGVLAFDACDQSGSNDNEQQLLPLLLLGGGETYAIGDTGPSGVGIVFYITDDGKHGLEAAPSDQSAGNAWSTITDALANASGTAIGTGYDNTDAIIIQNSGASSAAKVCRDYTGGGLTDWFLPSKDELNQLRLQRAEVGGFADVTYWSSSEGTVAGAWGQTMSNGDQAINAKNGPDMVRAIRAF